MEGNAMSSHYPWADANEARHESGLDLIGTPAASAYDDIVLTVAHDASRAAGTGALRSYGRGGGVFCDFKSAFARDDSDLRL